MVVSLPKICNLRLPRQKCSIILNISMGFSRDPGSGSSSIMRSMSTFAWIKLPSVDLRTVPLNLETVQDFVDQVGHQTMSAAYIENKHFFTKSCHRQTYQNYEKPPQSLQNLYFQSHFLASKIKRIFLIFFLWRIFD